MLANTLRKQRVTVPDCWAAFFLVSPLASFTRARRINFHRLLICNENFL